MPLALYNTLTRRKDPFEPLDKKNVRMYVCGPTVYDFAHIGNARPVIVFDVLYRLLRHCYGADHVRYVRNITDVDDKINAAAQANGESIRALTERTAKAFHQDVAALGCLPPDVEPRATDHVPAMIAMIERLIAQGHAYAAEGHVLFAVASDPQYGKLSRRNRDEMIAGARVEVAPYKRDPADFVLWKPSSAELPGWESPWGRGRPGWHIECSAMSEQHLGESFDIHGGGLDLIFPHHENEIAQSEAVHGGKEFAKFWLHNGFVTLNGAKMAKSEGNFRTIRAVLGEAPGEAARLMMLKTHYRHPLDWTSEGLREAKSNLDRWYRLFELADATENTGEFQDRAVEADEPLKPAMEALLDDLNTPGVISLLNLQVNEAFHANALGTKAGDFDFRYTVGEVRKMTNILGLLQHTPSAWFKWRPDASTGSDEAEIEDLIAARNAARRARNFAEADRIRTELALKGILLEDGPSGTTWRRAS